MSKQKTKHGLTNENLTRYYTDNFMLALDAIEKARSLIRVGKEVTISNLLDQMAKTALLERETNLDQSSKPKEEES